MDWWIIAIVIITVVFLIADWFIVMGPDMRRWKGDGKRGKR